MFESEILLQPKGTQRVLVGEPEIVKRGIILFSQIIRSNMFRDETTLFG